MTGAAPADRRLILYAPNVHTGGGAVLLQALLQAWPAEQRLVAWLDARSRGRLAVPADGNVTWIEPSLKSRLGGEYSLARTARQGDRVLCFHGLPPLFPNAAEVVVFAQNRLHLGGADMTRFALRTRLRIRAEQFIAKTFRHRVATYWVQTPSMSHAFRAWAGDTKTDVRVLPFAGALPEVPHVKAKEYDFVYIADGEAHKNHRTLVQAWILLKQRGISPLLVLTLSGRDTVLKQWVAQQAAAHGLRIDDLGIRPHAQVPVLYSQSRALIFPSLDESFGLPLVEASALGLPILAGERDYVRDVCRPAETFDPMSAVSIERAVLRFLGKDDIPQLVASAGDFLRNVMD